jgi:hypothetical protein
MMKLKPLRARLRNTCSEVGAFRHQLDVRDMRVGHVLAHVLQTLVVGLAPAAVVVWADKDHRDVELARFDIGDLQIRATPGRRCRRSRPRRANRRRWRTVRSSLRRTPSADAAAVGAVVAAPPLEHAPR